MSTNTIKFKGVVYAENTSIQVPSGTLYEVKELKSDSLEANSLSITVTSNDTSILKYKKNDKVEYFRDGKRKGIFYLQSVKRVGPNDYSLYGLSALGRLLQMKHVGGIYTGESVATVVQEICGSVPVIVETVYARVKLYGYLPYADGVTTSARDNLVQVLFAIGAYLGTDENGVIRVEKLWDGTISAIEANRISSQNCDVEYLDPVSAVEVVEHSYTPSTDDVTLFEGVTQEGDTVVFSEPVHNLSAVGFDILKSGTNYAVLSAGNGTLTGKSYLHSTRVIQRTVSTGVEENVLTVDGATLVSLVNSAAVTDRLAEYYTHREQIRAVVDVDQERVGHVVNLYHPWDKKLVSACLSEREVSISGILEANTVALVGFVPQQPDTTITYDYRAFITETSSWVIPEGVTSLHIVLIGGGQGGSSGESGKAGGNSSSATASPGNNSYTEGKKGGKGGKAGLGGLGGRVYSVDLPVTPGQSVSIVIGIGGDGAIVEQTAGSLGSATTLTYGTTSLSSDSGSSGAAGYYDPITKQTYADSGVAGQIGGDGGEGGRYGDASASKNGTKGQDIGSNAGGAGGSEFHTSGGQYLIKYGRPTSTSTGRGSLAEVGDSYSGYTSYTYNENTGTFSLSGYKTLTVTDVHTVPEGIQHLYNSVSGTSTAIDQIFLEYETYAGVDRFRPNYSRISRGSAQYGSPGYYTGKAGGGGGGASAISSGSSGAAGTGGAGASGGSQPAATSYGQGGNGGNGGGGGGGAGGSGTEVNAKYSSSYTTPGSSGGAGGAFGTGGKGGNGCAIIYYGVPKYSQAGAAVTKDNKWRVDKNGKLCIV